MSSRACLQTLRPASLRPLNAKGAQGADGRDAAPDIPPSNALKGGKYSEDQVVFDPRADTHELALLSRLGPIRVGLLIGGSIRSSTFAASV